MSNGKLTSVRNILDSNEFFPAQSHTSPLYLALEAAVEQIETNLHILTSEQVDQIRAEVLESEVARLEDSDPTEQERELVDYLSRRAGLLRAGVESYHQDSDDFDIEAPQFADDDEFEDYDIEAPQDGPTDRDDVEILDGQVLAQTDPDQDDPDRQAWQR